MMLACKIFPLRHREIIRNRKKRLIGWSIMLYVAAAFVLSADIALAQCGDDTLCIPVEEGFWAAILRNWDRFLVLAIFLVIPLIICGFAFKRKIKKWVIVLMLILVFYLAEFFVKSILGYN